VEWGSNLETGGSAVEALAEKCAPPRYMQGETYNSEVLRPPTVERSGSESRGFFESIVA
jgi:hypothetical protein